MGEQTRMNRQSAWVKAWKTGPNRVPVRVDPVLLHRLGGHPGRCLVADVVVSGRCVERAVEKLVQSLRRLRGGRVVIECRQGMEDVAEVQDKIWLPFSQLSKHMCCPKILARRGRIRRDRSNMRVSDDGEGEDRPHPAATLQKRSTSGRLKSCSNRPGWRCSRPVCLDTVGTLVRIQVARDGPALDFSGCGVFPLAHLHSVWASSIESTAGW